MAMQRSSIFTNNGSIQTFYKDGLHIQTEPVSEYVLLESASIPINSSRFFRLMNRGLTIQPLVIWFTPSVNNQSFNFIVRQDTISIYSLAISTANPYFVLPLMLLKPSQEIALGTPSGLSLANVYILAREVAYSEIFNGL